MILLDSKGKVHFLDTLSALIRRHQKQRSATTPSSSTSSSAHHTSAAMDPSRLPEKERHRMLFEMRRRCKKTTLRSIEQNMKCEKFTEVDLIQELNSVQFIQVRAYILCCVLYVLDFAVLLCD